MNLTTIIAPEFEPVTLEQVYGDLRLTPTGSPLEHPDDVDLLLHIASARKEVERITHRALVRQQLRLSTSDFARVFLLRPPLIGVSSVKYFDLSNTLVTLGADSWYVTDDLVPQLRLADNVVISTYDRRDAVRVEYWAGYPVNGSPGDGRDDLVANVPENARTAVLIGVRLLYEELTAEKRDRLEKYRTTLLQDLTIYGVA